MKPTIPEVLPVMRAFARLPGNGAAGSLHIVLDDGNVSDEDVRFCLEEARLRGDVPGAELAGLLLRMSRTQRRKLSALFYHDECPHCYKGQHADHGECVHCNGTGYKNNGKM